MSLRIVATIVVCLTAIAVYFEALEPGFTKHMLRLAQGLFRKEIHAPKP